ncbi:MAG: S41 family peptidase [Clostridia bacterium]|nr:S41 family peptidase [Clostridia bacterium]
MQRKTIIITAAVTAAVMLILTTLFYITPIGKYLYFSLVDTFGDSSYLKFYQVEQIIDDNYMGDADKTKMTDYGLVGYVAGVGDAYTNYLSVSDLNYMMSEMEGTYSGIGVEVGQKDEKIHVSSVKKGSPAEKAGILKGDFILKVNTEDYDAETLNEAISVIKSTPEGESVLLTLERDKQIIEITVIPEEIDLENVEYEMINSEFGYIRIKSFGTEVGKKFKEAADSLKDQGMKGLIIDLRANPGGLLDSVVEAVDYIVPEGTITTVKYKNKADEKYTSDEKELDMPICVLIDEGSASASEIMAGALRDYEKAILVGKNTFGKGVVQGIFELGDGSAVRVTIAKYYTPSGECIDKIGIAPDVEVGLPDGKAMGNFDTDFEDDTQFEKAMEILTNQIAS